MTKSYTHMYMTTNTVEETYTGIRVDGMKNGIMVMWLWALSTIMSQNKNGKNSGGSLYRELLERAAFWDVPVMKTRQISCET